MEGQGRENLGENWESLWGRRQINYEQFPRIKEAESFKKAGVEEEKKKLKKKKGRGGQQGQMWLRG